MTLLRGVQASKTDWLDVLWSVPAAMRPGTAAPPVCLPPLSALLQAIAFLAALCHEGEARPHLVVVPLSTLPNWQREFARFCPQLNVVVLAGNAEARAVVKEHELFGQGLGQPTISAAASGEQRIWAWGHCPVAQIGLSCCMCIMGGCQRVRRTHAHAPMPAATPPPLVLASPQAAAARPCSAPCCSTCC